MRRWFAEPVTRAEAIGWALTIPAVIYIGQVGTGIVRLLPHAGWVAGRYPDLTPAFLDFSLRLGAGGLIAVFVCCAIVPLGAQFSRQRPLVRIAAPLICALLVHSASTEFIASWRDLLQLATVVDGPAAVEGAPR